MGASIDSKANVIVIYFTSLGGLTTSTLTLKLLTSATRNVQRNELGLVVILVVNISILYLKLKIYLREHAYLDTVQQRAKGR